MKFSTQSKKLLKTLQPPFMDRFQCLEAAEPLQDSPPFKIMTNNFEMENCSYNMLKETKL